VLGRPVRWMSDRTEAMLSDNAGRDLVSVAELAFDETNKITAYRVRTAATSAPTIRSSASHPDDAVQPGADGGL
jgi:CO/xanthine dehydrogenase Mo-binding subunit